MKKTDKNYEKWSLYDRAQIVAHHRKFGVANLEGLYKTLSHRRSIDGIFCEIHRFDGWIKTGIMEFLRKKDRQRFIGARPGVIKAYIKIINELGL